MDFHLSKYVDTGVSCLPVLRHNYRFSYPFAILFGPRDSRVVFLGRRVTFSLLYGYRSGDRSLWARRSLEIPATPIDISARSLSTSLA